MSEVKKPTGTWSISIFVDCPKCDDNFDAMDDVDFWEDNKGIKLGLNDDPVYCICPYCWHKFEADLEW